MIYSFGQLLEMMILGYQSNKHVTHTSLKFKGCELDCCVYIHTACYCRSSKAAIRRYSRSLSLGNICTADGSGVIEVRVVSESCVLCTAN